MKRFYLPLNIFAAIVFFACSNSEQSGMKTKDAKQDSLCTDYQNADSSLPQGLFFPADNDVWNMPVDQMPIDPYSDAILRNHSGGNISGLVYVECVLPYNVIDTRVDHVPFIKIRGIDPSYDDPATDSFPFRDGMRMQAGRWENDPANVNEKSDHHFLVVDSGAKMLYEIYQLRKTNGEWYHEGAARFDLNSNKPRSTVYQTSADAAGLPIFPGLVRVDEIERGEINHALRMTLNLTFQGYVKPAVHCTTTGYTSNDGDGHWAPMGMRLRLKAEVKEADFPKEASVIIRCLKKYGVIIADNGKNFAISGTDDCRFTKYPGFRQKKGTYSLRLLNNRNVDIKIKDFEVIKMDAPTPCPR